MNDPLSRATGLTVGEFAASYWGAAPLLRRATQLPQGGFTDLLSLAAIDELLSRRGLRTPFVRMSRDGDVLSPSRFTRGGGAGAEISDQVADDKVLAEFAAGATLVLQGLHRMWPPIQEFAGALTSELGHPVQVNAYVTPPQNKGFAPHYDVHDVFVLQFAGRKHWQIHEPICTSPLRDQPWHERKAAVAARSAETPLIDTVLEAGDTLYLPRGYLHSATSLGEVSGHLTVGVHPVTRQTLVDQVFVALADDVELRRSLPLGVDLSNETVLDGELEATVAALRAAIDRLDRSAVARGVGRHLAATTRPAPLRPLEQLSAAATLAPENLVRLRPGLRLTLRTEGQHLVIELPDKEVRVKVAAAEATRVATSGNAVTADGLPGVDVGEGLTLLSQLLRDGIVVPA
ncbi:MAG: cupin-like domain-containing protein [Candidatus Eremiobacteraeota bacterium]|nr:cupin-like domain-containing protein [Candidatus Eremiobacteraeota bacterium]